MSASIILGSREHPPPQKKGPAWSGAQKPAACGSSAVVLLPRRLPLAKVSDVRRIQAALALTSSKGGQP
jgi:hypothetical protein